MTTTTPVVFIHVDSLGRRPGFLDFRGVQPAVPRTGQLAGSAAGAPTNSVGDRQAAPGQ